MAFTAKDVMTLREKTGAGMLDCKNALVDADGDMDKAAELLRERGIAKAVKKEGRIAAEGAVGAYVEGKRGVLIEINCESDFVSAGDLFKQTVAAVAKLAVERKPSTVEELEACPLEGGTVKDYMSSQTAKTGEKMSIRRFAIYETEGELATYIHMGGKCGVMVEAADCKGDFADTLHDVTLQIAASRPSYIAREDVPEAVLAKEKEIALEQIKNDPKNAAKPDNVKEKMIDGKIKKFYQDSCLLDQAFVKDDSKNMAAVIGDKFRVARFERFEMGEGLEKRSQDLGDEVAKQVEAAKGEK